MKKLQKIVLAQLVLAMLMLSACATAEHVVELKGQQFKVDLALTRDEQARGLMFVEEMADDQGMLFVFSYDAPRSFWMKNTKIPLDIMYFDKDLKLVSIAADARPCRADPCRTYPSGLPARYVLELNSGKAQELGLEHGDVLTLLFDLP